MEEQNIASGSCDEKSGKHKHDDIGTLCLVGRHRWDMDCCFFHGHSMYETNSESVMAKSKDLHHPFPVDYDENFLNYEKNNSSSISLDLGQPMDVEVGGSLSIVVSQHPFLFSRDRNLNFVAA